MDDVVKENVMKPNDIAKEARETAKKWIKRKGWEPLSANIDRFKYLIAIKGDEKKVVIVKGTTGIKNHFGAVTLTAFKAINNSDCVFLLVDITNKDSINGVRTFSLEEILKHMFIPPFKIDFVINQGSKARKNGKGVDLDDINNLIKYYDKIKERSIKK